MKTVKISQENWDWLKLKDKTPNKALDRFREGRITLDFEERFKQLEEKVSNLAELTHKLMDFVSSHSGGQFSE